MFSAEQEFNSHLTLTAELGVPVAGSIGRAAIIGNPAIQPLCPNGKLRDIDIVNVGQHETAARQLPDHDIFDTTWLTSYLQPVAEGHTLTYPGRYPSFPVVSPRVVVEVPRLNELLQPVGHAAINGQEIAVLHPEAQLALDSMLGMPHPKNRSDMQKLAAVAAAIPVYDRLDPELTEPFMRFGREINGLFRAKLYRYMREACYAGMTPLRARGSKRIGTV